MVNLITLHGKQNVKSFRAFFNASALDKRRFFTASKFNIIKK